MGQVRGGTANKTRSNGTYLVFDLGQVEQRVPVGLLEIVGREGLEGVGHLAAVGAARVAFVHAVEELLDVAKVLLLGAQQVVLVHKLANVILVQQQAVELAKEYLLHRLITVVQVDLQRTGRAFVLQMRRESQLANVMQ